MPNHDPERDRVAGVYSAMSDQELREIAQSGDELTEGAYRALESEIARRGLTITITPPAGFDVYELNETVTLRKFRDLPEALLAKGSLESAGIQAYLFDDNMVRMDWFYSNLMGGIKLKVRPEDVEAAEEILSQPIPETIDVEGVGNFEQPKCPACQSLDTSYQELNESMSYGSAFLGVPIPFHAKAWKCNSCGNQWDETTSEPDAEIPGGSGTL